MKQKHIGRWLAALLAGALTCTAFTGCTKESAADIEGVKDYVAPAEDSEGTLKILVNTTDKTAVEAAKRTFRTKYPKVQVELTTYETRLDDSSELEKLFTKQMTGDGADIVLMDCYNFQQICDIDKVQQAGAYIDLNQYFNKDPDWSWDGYSKAVVDGMMQGNKLYCLPLFYELPVLVTTDKLLEQSGIDLKKCDTGIGLMEELTKCAEREKQAESGWSVLSANYPQRFHELFDVDPVTFGSGKATVKFTKDFEKTLEAYDALGQQLGWFEEWTEEREIQFFNAWNEMFYVQLAADHCYFVYSDYFNPLFQGLYSIASMEKLPVMVPVYTADGSGISAAATLTASVATGCKTPELAYEFVKCLLSDDAQAKFKITDNDGSGSSSGFDIPLKQSVIGTVAESAGAGQMVNLKVEDAAGNEVIIHASEYIEQFIELSEQVVHTYMFLGTEYLGKMYSEGASQYFEPYFKRTKSLENCYDDAETQLEIYATE